MQPGSGAQKSPNADDALPVQRVDLNHRCGSLRNMEKLPFSPGSRRADLTARRVRRRSIGKTEKAKAGV